MGDIGEISEIIPPVVFGIPPLFENNFIFPFVNRWCRATITNERSDKWLGMPAESGLGGDNETQGADRKGNA
jgi:hypothetical protein